MFLTEMWNHLNSTNLKAPKTPITDKKIFYKDNKYTYSNINWKNYSKN